MDHPVLRAALLAALLLGLAAAPANARRGSGDGARGSGDGWRAVRLCQSEGCWAKHRDGWGPAPRERHGRR